MRLVWARVRAEETTSDLCYRVRVRVRAGVGISISVRGRIGPE